MSGRLGVEKDRGLFYLPKEKGRPKTQFLFRVRVIDGLPYICFLDTWNSRGGKRVEVLVPFSNLIEEVHRYLCQRCPGPK